MEVLLNELVGDSVRIVPMGKHHAQDLYKIGKEPSI